VEHEPLRLDIRLEALQEWDECVDEECSPLFTEIWQICAEQHNWESCLEA
jgi:hypothetical protein